MLNLRIYLKRIILDYYGISWMCNYTFKPRSTRFASCIILIRVQAFKSLFATKLDSELQLRSKIGISNEFTVLQNHKQWGNHTLSSQLRFWIAIYKQTGSLSFWNQNQGWPIESGLELRFLDGEMKSTLKVEICITWIAVEWRQAWGMRPWMAIASPTELKTESEEGNWPKDESRISRWDPLFSLLTLVNL